MSNTGPHATRVFAISELVRSNASIERSTERSEYSTGGLSLSSTEEEEEEALASRASAIAYSSAERSSLLRFCAGSGSGRRGTGSAVDERRVLDARRDHRQSSPLAGEKV